MLSSYDSCNKWQMYTVLHSDHFAGRSLLCHNSYWCIKSNAWKLNFRWNVKTNKTSRTQANPHSLYSVWQKVSPKVVCHFLSNRLEFYGEISRTCSCLSSRKTDEWKWRMGKSLSLATIQLLDFSRNHIDISQVHMQQNVCRKNHVPRLRLRKTHLEQHNEQSGGDCENSKCPRPAFTHAFSLISAKFLVIDDGKLSQITVISSA